MKNIIKLITCFLLITVFTTNASTAQEATGKESEIYKRQIKVYQNALKFNDVSVAKNALYNMLAIDPSNSSILDSLAYLYYDYQQYASSLLVARDILAINSNHLPALEIQAVSFEKLGLYDKALSAYESLYLKRNNPYTLYKIGMLQYDLKRHNESKTSLEILLADKAVDELKVVLNEQGSQEQKEIPMKAALHNFQGLNHVELGNKEAAKQSFEAALKLAPDYKMAKDNLGKI
jgi:tetratricopeptide (TPR) repeat protein